MIPLYVFVGYDPREAVAFHVLAHSILRRASRPVAIVPLVRDHLQPTFIRPHDPAQSTEFTYTRFLVPWLCDYRGLAIFMDCDMLVQADMWELVELTRSGGAVWVCQHDYTPKHDTKMDGRVQTAYPRKNWSSLMVFNLQHAGCRRLTPEYVNTASGMDLHRFAWLKDREIGPLPLEWNYLVGESNQSLEPPKIIHYTGGGPWCPGYDNIEFADMWLAERDHMLGSKR